MIYNRTALQNSKERSVFKNTALGEEGRKDRERRHRIIFYAKITNKFLED